MENLLASAELNRRGMAAIEERLAHGPVHLIKRNRKMAVVISEEDYSRLINQDTPMSDGLTATQWLLNQTSTGKRSKKDINDTLNEGRSW